MGWILWNFELICTDLAEKAAGHCWTYGHLICFGGGRPDRMVPGFRLMRWVMSLQLLSPWLHILVHFTIRCSLFWFWVHSILQNLTLSSNCFHISEMWMQFFPLAGWWNHLMVCWLSSFFLSVVSEIFYIKAGYCLPSSLRYMLNLQLSPPAFKIFLYLYIYIYIYFLRAMRSFPEQIFLLLVFVLQHSFLDL